MKCRFLVLIVKIRMAFPSLPMISKTCLCRQMGSSFPLPSTTVPIRQRLKISLIGSLDLKATFGIPSRCCCWQLMTVIGVPKPFWSKLTTELHFQKNPYKIPIFSLPNFQKNFDENKGILDSKLEAQFQNALAVFVEQL